MALVPRLADTLTGLRLLLALPFALLLLERSRGAALWAGAILAVAIATDVLDGRLARASGQVNAYGRAFDHTTDFLFVFAGLCALAVSHVVPWPLPILVAVSFAQYAVDSYLLHRARDLRMSALGRWNGILYFVPLVGDVLVRSVLTFAEPLLAWISWALVATTLASMADRALAFLRPSRTAPGSPAAGTRGRSPR